MFRELSESPFAVPRHHPQQGFAEFSNEVQHLDRVLAWDRDIDSSALRSGLSLPVYGAKGPRSGKSLQPWIAPSSVARELKRNSGAQVGYTPVYAHEQTRARRWSGSKLDRDAALRERVLAQLAVGWSPEQIAGRSRGGAAASIGTETIYRFIYAQIDRHKGLQLAPLPAARQVQAWPAARQGRQSGPAYEPARAAERAARRGHGASGRRTLGGRPDGLLPLSSEHPDAARAQQPHPGRQPPRLQARRSWPA